MVFAILLSGGTGTRMGTNIPKQYIEVNGKPIFAYSLNALLSNIYIDKIQIVTCDAWKDYIYEWICKLNGESKFSGFSNSGDTRQLSIFNALQDIKDCKDDDIVFIHDAARPFLSQKQINDCLLFIKDYDGVLPVLNVKDTVYISKNGKSISGLLNRNEVFAGQAPEAFLYGKYLKANKDLMPNQIYKINGSTEPAILSGMNIAMIDGDENNFKITTSMDLTKFKQIINQKGDC